MSKIYSFPDQSVRSFIHNAIKLYATGRWSRQQMVSEVFNTLNQYKVSRLNVGDYSVRILGGDDVVTLMCCDCGAIYRFKVERRLRRKAPHSRGSVRPAL